MDDRVIAGRYQLIDRLDSGGTSEVWRAQDTSLNRTVAVKILKGDYAQLDGYADRFASEAKAAASLTDPHVVTIYDWGQHENLSYLVMEFISGESLKQLLGARGALDPRQAVDIALSVAAALAHAHDAGVIHRNVKPEYVLLGAQGEVKLTDFGVAREPEIAGGETRVISGDARYISPEQAQGRPTGAATDVYGLGVVLFEMLTGRVPFVGDTPVEIAMKHVNEQPVTPSAISTAVPAALDRIVLKALAKDPAGRYASVKDMADDLMRFEHGAAPVAAKRSAAGAWIAGIVALVVVAAAAFAFVSWRGGSVATVPALVSLKAADASAAVAAAGLIPLEQAANSPTAAAGIVVAQDPAAGTKAKKGSTVTFTVSGGKAPVAVGNYVGLQLSDALQKVVADQLVDGNVTRQSSDTYPAGTVMQQSPSAGTQVPPGTKVDLVASSGQAKAQVPDVTGMSRANAAHALSNLGFAVSVVTQFSATQANGIVYDQDPGPSTTLAKGATVTIFVSKGIEQVTVPDVVGLTEVSATNTLQGKGFTVLVGSIATSDTAQVGVVQSQDPGADGTAPKGSAVKIVVGK